MTAKFFGHCKGESEKKNSQNPAICAGVLALGFVLAAGLLWYPPFWQKAYSPAQSGVFAKLEKDDTVNINTAGLHQLQLLPGIGAEKAGAILSHRQVSGKFKSLDDLLQVEGIGPATVEKLKGLVSF